MPFFTGTMKRLALFGVLAAPLAAHAQEVVVLALTCTPTSVGPLVQGEIKNLSSQPLKLVSITSTFRDGNGAFVSTEPNILATFRPILPGQTSPFKGYGDTNPAITQVTIAPSLVNGRALASSGKSSAPCPAGR